jgi:hypothetical protein
MTHTGRGLIIMEPWAERILIGKKTWEIRGSKTHIRGKIDIIQSGTGHDYGTANLVDCIGPFEDRKEFYSYDNWKIH